MRMRCLACLLALLFAPALQAQVALTFTASTLTMEVGGPVPPLVWVQNTYPTTCTGTPTLSTTATSASAVGTYTISASAGTYACAGYTITYVNGTMNVIAADGKGAQINNSVVYPPLAAFTSLSVGAIDVTNNSTCNMVGDNATDNTTCLNNLLQNRTYLYFPPGIYLTSGAFTKTTNTWQLLGVGPQQSIIRLAPNSAAFNTGTATAWFNPASVSGNANFREFINGIGFDVGYGNPNAVPVTLVMNNAGAIRNSIIWSEDGNCPYALSFNRAFPGPALAKDLAIYGCQQAISSNQVEYNWTFDELTTEGQTGRIIASTVAHFNIQHWLSDGSMSADHALQTAAEGTIAILDSSLLNGSGSQAGIVNVAGGSVYVRNTTVTGYSPSEADSGTGTTVNYTGNLTQNWTGSAASIFNANLAPSSLYLPEQETPLPTDDPTPSNWTELGTNQSTWCASITGSASATVYAPLGSYSTGAGTYSCTIPSTVNHINMYNSTNSSQNAKWTFTIASNGGTPLVIDGCMYAVCTIVHTGTRVVIVRDSYLNTYQASPGAGNAFFEDVVNYGGSLRTQLNFYSSQSVWARQLDLESNTTPQFICNGCTLWLLGYKIECASPDVCPPVQLNNGSQAEIFGAFYYPLSGISAGNTAPIYSTNSKLFTAPTFSFPNIAGRGWQYWVQETKGLATGVALNPAYPTGADPTLNMYYSTTGSASVYPSASAGVTLQ